ncbi:potassium voltage-gated channel subfamily C member 1-like [Ruditapes philippinarum]|uniref:potassium voltage-gated channel subfamily C member 1-like n=1 Tax=Ruditapes philippinarum TaxID=129788 RepID=UPI00295A9A6D|nr:potassium voltage-gated channel subfamily C member 1-like [Ruditapes philippinarum]
MENPANHGEPTEVVFQVVNISGTKFKVFNTVWLNIRNKVPLKFRNNLHALEGEVFVARDSRVFQAIFYEHLGGELHIPSDMCPSIFRKELNFWGIEETDLAKCCFVKYMTYFDDQNALKILERDERRKTEEKRILDDLSYHAGWQGIQAKIWLILNEPYHSYYSKIYFILHMIIITVSLFALVAGTHHTFQRPLNIHEWKVYFGEEWDIYSHHFYDTSNIDAEAEEESRSDAEVESLPEPEVESETEPEVESEAEPEVESEAEPEVESEAEPEVESEAEPEAETEWINATTTGVQTTPEPTPEEPTDSEPVNNEAEAEDSLNTVPLPENTRARFVFLDVIEFFSIAFFTIDLIVRIVVCPFRCKLLYSFLHWVDVFALAVMYAKYIVEAISPREKYEASVLDILHCLQVVRILQMFRLVESPVGFRVLLYAFKASGVELMHMSLFLFVAMLLFSTFIYFSGDPNFPNIPDAFWWSLITMTTVGYGDMVPKQPLSRLVGVLCAITGVCVIAVIIPIFVNNFMLFYAYSKLWGREKESNDTKHKINSTQVIPFDQS